MNDFPFSKREEHQLEDTRLGLEKEGLLTADAKLTAIKNSRDNFYRNLAMQIPDLSTEELEKLLSNVNASVSGINGINNIECSIQSNFLTFIELGTVAETTPGGCEWSFQYNKNL